MFPQLPYEIINQIVEYSPYRVAKYFKGIHKHIDRTIYNILYRKNMNELCKPQLLNIPKHICKGGKSNKYLLISKRRAIGYRQESRYMTHIFSRRRRGIVRIGRFIYGKPICDLSPIEF